jgi:pimeloyl-ACP methyl ester carboxylesterase
MKPLIPLHGALGAASQLLPLATLLKKDFAVYVPDFSGHGTSTNDPDKFQIEAFAAEMLVYMDMHQLNQASFFGYSMGGFVALYLASHYPARISGVFTLATKLHWNEAIANRKAGMLDAGRKLKPKYHSLQQRSANGTRAKTGGRLCKNSGPDN